MKKLLWTLLVTGLVFGTCFQSLALDDHGIKTSFDLLDEYPEPDIVITVDPLTDPKLVLVNKTYKLKSTDVPELRNVNVPVPKSEGTQQMQPEAAKALEDMINDARKGGIELYLVSGYRSYWTQKSIYQRKVEQRGEASASFSSASAGASEHQTGLAADLTCKAIGYNLNGSFSETPEGKWVYAHCEEYGFVIRYRSEWNRVTGYKGEPWHIRYIGKDYARLYNQLNVPYEYFIEYLNLIYTGARPHDGLNMMSDIKCNLADTVHETLNMYESADFDSAVITVLESGASAYLLETGEQFSRVQAYGYIGYVGNECVYYPENAYKMTTTSPLKMRAYPSKEAPMTRQVENQSRVTVLLKGDEWSFINYQDRNGYVLSKFLK